MRGGGKGRTRVSSSFLLFIREKRTPNSIQRYEIDKFVFVVVSSKNTSEFGHLCECVFMRMREYNR